MKLLKSFLVILLTGAMTSAYGGSVRSPRDSRGNESSIEYAGATAYFYDSAKSTGPVVVSSTARGVVYGVIASSVAIGTYLVFRDSNTANATSSTATIVYNSTDASNAGGSIYGGASATRYFEFPVPIRFMNGIVVGASLAPSGGGTSAWTILYRIDNVD